MCPKTLPSAENVDVINGKLLSSSEKYSSQKNAEVSSWERHWVFVITNHQLKGFWWVDDKNYRWRAQESHWVYKEGLRGPNSVRFQNLHKFAAVADLTKLFWKRFCLSFLLSMLWLQLVLKRPFWQSVGTRSGFFSDPNLDSWQQILTCNVTYLNDSGHLLREDVKEFDLSWNTRAVFSMGKQSKSGNHKQKFLLTMLIQVILHFYRKDPVILSTVHGANDLVEFKDSSNWQHEHLTTLIH